MFRRGGGGVGGGAGRGSFNPPSFLNRASSGSSNGSSGAGNGKTAVASPGLLRRSGSAHGQNSNVPAPTRTHDDSYDESEHNSDEEPQPNKSAARTPQRSSHGPVAQHTPLTSSTSHSPQSAASSGDEYYMCMWRKPQGRKHKTWDGDAVLIVSRTRGNCKLKCQASGRELGFSAKLIKDDFESGDELTIGGKEIEVDRRISHREYLSGIPESLQWPASKKSLTQHASSRASTVSPLPQAAPVSRSRLMAAAPAASFYGTPSAKAKPKRETSSEDVARSDTSPEPMSGARARKREDSAHATPAPARKNRDSPSASSSSRTAKSPSLQPRPHGLFNSKDKPEPRYDPKAPGAVVMQAPSEEHSKQYNRRGDAIVDVVVNPVLSQSLRPHQVEGVKFLYDRVMGISEIGGSRGAILADEMGLGKTLQTITLVETLLRQSPYYSSSSPRVIEKALIVCPLSLVKNWQREFRKWLGANGSSNIGVVAVDGSKGREVAQHFVTSKRDSVLIIGYEKLRSCIDILGTAQPPVGLIVCDEGHRLKSKDAKTTKMFDQLKTDRRLILTGTPIQNDLSELYAMIDFVCPGLLGSYAVFKQIFEDPILKSRMQYCSPEVKQLGQQRSGVLSDVTKLVVLRRTATILDGYLRPKSESVLFCAPTRLQLDLYRHILQSSQVKALTDGAGGAALPLITLLRQVCNSPELLLKHAEASSTSGTVAKAKGKRMPQSLACELLEDALDLFPTKRTVGDAALSGKLIALTRILGTIKAETDDKVVVVSTFTATLDVLEALCARLRYPVLRLDGTTKQDERQTLVNRFNTRPRSDSFVFLLSTRAGGVGLNLVGGNRLFLMEPEWNPALDQQAMARIHRDGQKKRCYIYRMMMSGTMDEKIFQRQIQKLGLSATLMTGDDARGEDGADSDESDEAGTRQGSGNRKRRKGDGGGGGGGGGASSSVAKAGDTFTPEELKDIFTLHEDTPCLCHDLLMCECPGAGTSDQGGADGGESEGDEDEDDGPPLHFVPASQQQAQQEAERIKTARHRLAGLADWRHLDTTASGAASSRHEGSPLASFSERVAAVAECDDVLSRVVGKQRPSVRSVREDQGQGSKASSEASPGRDAPLLEQTDLDHLERSIAADRENHRGQGASPWHIEAEEAGNVLYVLQRQSGNAGNAGANKAGRGGDDGGDDDSGDSDSHDDGGEGSD
ncbi:unnamed protein product [Parajaminaea phylloscopi]